MDYCDRILIVVAVVHFNNPLVKWLIH